jgi:glucan phosphorylase
MLRSAANLGIPIVGVTLLHRKGYFHQELDGEGRQSERAEEWQPETVLEPVEATLPFQLNGQRMDNPGVAILARGRYRPQGAGLFSRHRFTGQSVMGTNTDQ